MDMSWVWLGGLTLVFFANFSLEALVGTTNLYKYGLGRFYHIAIFRWLWSGPVYGLPLVCQPRLPTATGTWWAGQIGDEHRLLTDQTWAAEGWMDGIGWALFAAAWFLWIWAFIPKHPWAMQPPKTICRVGPYRHVRHPINVGWLLFCTGWYMLWGGVHAVVFVPVWYAFFILESFWEENYLLQVGDNQDAYRQYREEVGMFLPKLGVGRAETVAEPEAQPVSEGAA